MRSAAEQVIALTDAMCADLLGSGPANTFGEPKRVGGPWPAAGQLRLNDRR